MSAAAAGAAAGAPSGPATGAHDAAVGTGAAGGARRRRVGIVGYGKLGAFLARHIQEDAEARAQLELAFVWNRTVAAVEADIAEGKLPAAVLLRDLGAFAERGADLIVEVAHPAITRDFGPRFVEHADYFCGSPTAFADAAVETAMREAAGKGAHGVYIPSGAFWGAEDIQKMDQRGTLGGLTVGMRKHPSSLKVLGELQEKLQAAFGPDGSTPGPAQVLYEGPVRALCPLAPNNVNTMAAAAIAAKRLGGFDAVVARLVADPSLDAHIVEVTALGPAPAPLPDGTPGERFRVHTERYNPAPPGAVTGSATFMSFMSSVLRAHGRGSGVHMC